MEVKGVVFRYARVACIATMCLFVMQDAALFARPQKGKLAGKQKVSAEVKLAHDKVKPGMRTRAILFARIQDGWHINSPTPADENLIGTSLEISKNKILDSVALHFAKGVEQKFEYADSPIEVYEGTMQVVVELFVSANAKLGMHRITASLSYQACSENVCLAPTSLAIEIPLRVVDQNVAVSRINQKLFEQFDSVLK